VSIPTQSSLAVPDPSGPPSPPYSVALEVAYPPELNRWLPLVKWLLVIPHFICLFALGIGAFFVSVIAWFAVLFTGRYPRGLFEYNVGVYRWLYRVLAYNYPVRVDIAYPEHMARWRPLVQWLLAIPYLFVGYFLYWLTGVITFVAFFTILFTKRIPRSLYEVMIPGMRWYLRGGAYAYFLTARYPPWVWG
jgi:hypothetical protein